MVLLLYAACFLVTMFSARERRYRRPSVPEVRGDARVSLLLSQVETGIYLSVYLSIYLYPSPSLPLSLSPYPCIHSALPLSLSPSLPLPLRPTDLVRSGLV